MGFATPAEENLRESISIDDWLIDKREASFMLHVKSNEMEDAGIYQDDMLIVERTDIARAGQIIITTNGETWAMQYYRDSSKMVEIAAVVKAVIRKYK